MKYIGKLGRLPVFSSDDVEDFEFRKGGITRKRIAELRDAIKRQREVMPGHRTFAGLITLRELEMLLAVAENELFEDGE